MENKYGKERVMAVIQVYNGGRYGRPEEYKAIIDAYYKKDGSIYKTKFDVIERLETLKKGYNYGTAKRSESIKYIIED